MDAVYAVGSSTIANVGIDADTLEMAVCLLENAKPDNAWDAAERDWLVELSRAALAAEPSDSVRSVYE